MLSNRSRASCRFRVALRQTTAHQLQLQLVVNRCRLTHHWHCDRQYNSSISDQAPVSVENYLFLLHHSLIDQGLGHLVRNSKLTTCARPTPSDKRARHPYPAFSVAGTNRPLHDRSDCLIHTFLKPNSLSSPAIMARVYADVNANMPRSYWDYDSVAISWGVLENYEIVRKIGM